MSEPDELSVGRDYESAIVGFEFTGDQLLTGEMLRLRQGLTVLYGLNGAGKTRVLRGVRAALLGIRDDVDMGMIVRAQVPNELPDSVRRWNIDVSRTPRPLTIALAQSMATSGMHDALSDPGSLASEHRISAASATEIIDAHIRMMAGDEDGELTAELLNSRLFLLVPTGTADHPAWDSWAVADLTLPAAHKADVGISSSYSQLDHLLDHLEGEEWTEALDDWQDANRTRALFPTGERFVYARRRTGVQVPSRFSPYDSGWPSGDGMRGIELQGSIDFGVDLLDLESDVDDSTSQFITAVVHSLADENLYKDEDERFTGLRDVAKYPGVSHRFADWRIQTIHAGFSETVGLEDLVENTIAEVATAISIVASDILKRVLPDAPRVALSITHPALRLTSPAFAWTFARTESRSQLGLNELSRAERSWAVRAINEALYTYQRELTPPSHPCALSSH